MVVCVVRVVGSAVDVSGGHRMAVFFALNVVRTGGWGGRR